LTNKQALNWSSGGCGFVVFKYPAIGQAFRPVVLAFLGG